MAVGEEMEKEFESKLRLQQQQQQLAKKQEAMQRANSIAFRAPQEQFTIDNFELGKMYGTGSYSKVLFFFYI
jgi:3-phosphoinositide dependent protein kinase-1